MNARQFRSLNKQKTHNYRKHQTSVRVDENCTTKVIRSIKHYI